jgi:DNA-binding CsgD family transcriptional regulator
MNAPLTSSDTPSNARTARSRYRHAEGSAARLRLLSDAAAALAADSKRSTALAAILARALEFLSVEDGLLLGMEDDGLLVHVGHGHVPPVGARPVANNALRAMLQAGALPLARQDVQTSLRIGREKRVGLELLIPLCFGGKNTGILVLISAREVPLPNAEDLATLQALGTMLAAALLVAAKPGFRIDSPDAADKLKTLTARELQVFSLMPRGLTNAAMAEQLGIAAGTVKVHIERILHKLDLRDRTQAAVRAASYGFEA